jgi:hypothetical protein
MPVFVNGELIPSEAIREEGQSLRQRPEWRDLPDDIESSIRPRQEAELRMIDCVLLRQAADKDNRPVDSGAVDREIERLRAENGGCRSAVDEGLSASAN